jgi:hypothetical protein
MACEQHDLQHRIRHTFYRFLKDRVRLRADVRVCPTSQKLSLREWISLRDVIRRNGVYFLNIYRLLVAFEELIRLAPASGSYPETVQVPASATGHESAVLGESMLGSMQLANPGLFSTLWKGTLAVQPIKIDADRVSEELSLVAHDAFELGLDATGDRVLAIERYVKSAGVIDFAGDEHLRHDVRVLRETLINELERRYVFIPDLERYQRHFDKSLGEAVDLAFPDASSESRSAANTYIYDEATASVFHSIRAAEYGLLALARLLLPARQRKHLDKLEWGAIIKLLRSKIEELNQLGKKKQTPDRQKKLDFYSEAIDQCVYFKNLWRDDTMHARGNYEGPDALKALTHVEEFMKLLALNGLKLPPKIPH